MFIIKLKYLAIKQFSDQGRKKPNPKDQYFLNWYDTTEIFLNFHSENGNSAFREEIGRTSVNLGKPKAI